MIDIHLINFEELHKLTIDYDACIMKSLNMGYFYFYDFKNPHTYHRLFSDIPSEESPEHLIPVNINNPDSPVYVILLKKSKCFDFVYYKGAGNLQNISHSLGQTPDMFFVKPIDRNYNVNIWFRKLSFNEYMCMNSYDSIKKSNTIWRDSYPNFIHICLGNNNEVNEKDANYLYMCFANGPTFFQELYTGNGIRVELNKPNWKMAIIKNIDSISNWIMILNDETQNVFRLNLPNPYQKISTAKFIKTKDSLIIEGNAHALNRKNQRYVYFLFSS